MSNLNGPTPAVTGIVRLRDVVRDDRIRDSAAVRPGPLARRGLRAEAVVDALQPRPVSIGKTRMPSRSTARP